MPFSHYGKLENIIWQVIQFLVLERKSLEAFNKIDIEPYAFIKSTAFYS